MNNDWQTDPVFPFEIKSSLYEKIIIPKHPCYNILYLNRGRVFYKKRDGFKIFNHKGFLVIPPLFGPRFRFDSGCRGYEITIGPILFDELTAKIVDRGLLYFPENDISYFSIKEQEGNTFDLIIENIFVEWKDKKSGFRDIIRLKLIELFINLTRIEGTDSIYSASVKDKGTEVDIHTGSKKIDDILAYLQKRYYEPLTLDELSEESGFSASYLSRYFKNKTGMCLFEYINKLRIQRACSLLKNTNKKIIEIAYEVGYNNISFFNRYFKKTMKISPMEYRKKVRK